MSGRIALSSLCVVFCLGATSKADAFGSGANVFDIEFVTIGDPGNPADTTGNPNPAGSVDYVYRIGKYKISEGMVNKANAASALQGNPLGITHRNQGDNKPATYVTWFEAAQFVNWLNTNQGYSPAYKFDGNGDFQLWQSGDAGYNPDNLFRNSLAYYFLPSVHGWYKAAYYDPTTGVYYDYPTGSDTRPTSILSGTGANTAVFGHTFAAGPADITQAGGLSPYGTMGQAGNAWEMEETDFDLVNDSLSFAIGVRGSSWYQNPDHMASSFRHPSSPGGIGAAGGFRVASKAIPEPTTAALALAATLCMVGRRRR